MSTADCAPGYANVGTVIATIVVPTRAGEGAGAVMRSGCSATGLVVRDIAAGLVTFLMMVAALAWASAVAQVVRPPDVYVAPDPAHTIAWQRSSDAASCAVCAVVDGLILGAARVGAR